MGNYSYQLTLSQAGIVAAVHQGKARVRPLVEEAAGVTNRSAIL